MPKVTQAHAQARRKQIVVAAACCFARDGFHRTTMHDICRQAALSPGAIYRYFAGKEEIIAAMVEERHRQGVALVEAARQKGNTLEILNALADHFPSELEDTEGAAVGIELWAEAIRSPAVQQMLRHEIRGIQDFFAGIIRAAQKRGDVSATVDARAVAQIMLSLFQGLHVQKMLDPDTDVAEYVHAMKAIMAGQFWLGPKAEGAE